MCVTDMDYLSALAIIFSRELMCRDTSQGPVDDSSERQQGTKNLFRSIAEIIDLEGINGSLFAVSFDDVLETLHFHISDGSVMSFKVYIEPREGVHVLQRVDANIELQRLVYVPKCMPPVVVQS